MRLTDIGAGDRRERRDKRHLAGPILAERAKYPELSAAFGVVQRWVTGVEGPPGESTAAIAAWGLLSSVLKVLQNR